MPSRAALELLLQLRDEATEGAQAVETALAETTAAYDETTAATDRLALAMLNSQNKAEALAQAEENLAHNTDPDKQDKLTEAVIKARVAYDNAAERAQKLADATEEVGDASEEAAEETEGLNISLTDIKSGFEMANKVVRLLKAGYDMSVGAAMENAKAQKELAASMGITVEAAGEMLEAQGKGIAMTREQIEATDKLAAQQDEAKRNWDDFWLGVGNTAAPAFTEWLTEVNDGLAVLSGEMTVQEAVEQRLARARGETTAATEVAAGEIDHYRNVLEETKVEYGRITDATGEFGDAMETMWRDKSAALEFENVTKAAQTFNLALQDVTPLLQEVGDAFDERTRRILFDLTLEKLAQDGWTEQERAFADALAVQYGIVGADALLMAADMEKAADEIAALGQRTDLTAQEAATAAEHIRYRFSEAFKTEAWKTDDLVESLRNVKTELNDLGGIEVNITTRRVTREGYGASAGAGGREVGPDDLGGGARARGEQ